MATQQQLVVLPQVKSEVINNKNLARAETHRLRRHLQSNHNIDIPKNSRSHINMLQPTVSQWFEQEFMAQDAVVSMEANRDDVHAIIDILPTEGFAGLSIQSDQQMIAEAVALNIPLLGSKDSNTIIHEDINTWAKQRGYNKNLIYSPSQTIHELCEQDIRTSCKWAIAFTMNNTELPDTALREEFLKTIEAVRSMGFDEQTLKAAGMDTFAARLRSYVNLDTAFSETVHEAIEEYGEIRHTVRSLEFALTEHVNEQFRQYQINRLAGRARNREQAPPSPK